MGEFGIMIKFSEEGFRKFCDDNGILQRDISQGLVNERIPAKEEQEARESYYEYMKRRSREEDEKMRSRLPSVKDVLSSSTLDAIATDALIWHRDDIIDDMIAFEDNSRWIHEDDYAYNTRLLVSMNKVLDYFGRSSKGTVERRKEYDATK